MTKQTGALSRTERPQDWESLPPELRARLAAYQGGTAIPVVASPRKRDFILAVDRGVQKVARHWLLTVNLLGGIYAGLPLLGPWLLSQGLTLPANAIYFVYSLTCHQKPSRSFFIFGHKICYCQRCMAIYTGIFLFGLLFGLVHNRIRPLRWRWMFLLWAPMALDGFTQLFGWRESTWELRVITGGLFALSCVWVAFPHLERAFGDIARNLESRFARLASRDTMLAAAATTE